MGFIGADPIPALICQATINIALGDLTWSCPPLDGSKIFARWRGPVLAFILVFLCSPSPGGIAYYRLPAVSGRCRGIKQECSGYCIYILGHKLVIEVNSYGK